MSARAATCAEDTPLAELQRLLAARRRPHRRPPRREDRRRRHAQRPPARARRAGGAGRQGGTDADGRAGRGSSASRPVFEAVAAVSRAVRGRLPRRRDRARHPARRAELRRRHRGRGRRDRPGAGARRRARRPRARAREVRHRGRALRRGRARRRRHRAHRVLRRAGRAADGRARLDPRGPLPPRLHDQRDGGLAQGRRPRPARRPVQRPARPRGEDGARPAQPLLHRRPDPDLPRRSATRTATASGWTTTPCGSRAARSRWGSSATSPRRGCATSWSRCSRRARSSTRSCGWPSSAPTGAIHPHLAADDEAVALLRRLTELRDRYGLEVPSWRLGLAALARRLPPDEVYGWLAAPEGAPPGRRGDRRRRHRRPAARRAARGRGGARRGGRAGRSVRARTRRSSRSRSPTCRRCTSTSSGCAASGSRSAAPTSPSSGWRSRRAWGRSSRELRRRKLNGELDGRESELAAAQGADRVIRWENAPGPVRGDLLDAGGRRQRGAVRLAQPRPRHRRRAASASRRTGAACARRQAPTRTRWR